MNKRIRKKRTKRALAAIGEVWRRGEPFVWRNMSQIHKTTLLLADGGSLVLGPGERSPELLNIGGKFVLVHDANTRSPEE